MRPRAHINLAGKARQGGAAAVPAAAVALQESADVQAKVKNRQQDRRQEVVPRELGDPRRRVQAGSMADGTPQPQNHRVHDHDCTRVKERVRKGGQKEGEVR